jgi:glutamyl-tRNA synthetase
MAKHWKDVEITAERLRAVRELLAGATRFEAEPLENDLRELAERLGIGAGKLFQPLRVALVGCDRSPGIFDVILLLGRDLAVARLDRALAELAVRRDPAGA